MPWQSLFSSLELCSHLSNFSSIIFSAQILSLKWTQFISEWVITICHFIFDQAFHVSNEAWTSVTWTKWTHWELHLVADWTIQHPKPWHSDVTKSPNVQPLCLLKCAFYHFPAWNMLLPIQHESKQNTKLLRNNSFVKIGCFVKIGSETKMEVWKGTKWKQNASKWRKEDRSVTCDQPVTMHWWDCPNVFHGEEREKQLEMRWDA